MYYFYYCYYYFFNFQKPFSDLHRKVLAPCHLGQETRGGASGNISPVWLYWGEQGKATERPCPVRAGVGIRADFRAFWLLVLSSLSLVSSFPALGFSKVLGEGLGVLLL